MTRVSSTPEVIVLTKNVSQPHTQGRAVHVHSEVPRQARGCGAVPDRGGVSTKHQPKAQTQKVSNMLEVRTASISSSMLFRFRKIARPQRVATWEGEKKSRRDKGD